MAQPEVVKVEIPKSPKFLAVARKTTECIGSHAKLTELQVEELQLAVGEACTNAIKYADPASTSVLVQYSITHDRIEVEVTNIGPDFTWPNDENVATSVTNLQEGGLGMYLMEQLMDEIQVRSESGVTAVTMIKMR